jgi:hypothetical protein
MRTKRPPSPPERNAYTAKRDAILSAVSGDPVQAPLIEVAERRVRAQLQTIADAEGAGFDKNAALASAAILRSLVSSEGERRQRAKQEVRTVASIPLDQIIAYLKTLPVDVRDALCRQVNGDGDDEGLL